MSAQRAEYPANALLRVGDIASSPGRPGLLPISRATWWRWVATGRAPAGRKIGENTTVWPVAAVLALGQAPAALGQAPAEGNAS